MSTLWYPGRPPFCTDELVLLLDTFVETLHELNAAQDVTRLEVLELVKDDALVTIEEESEECLGTDSLLNNLRTLFDDAMTVAHNAFERKDWNSLLELATNMLVVRNELKEKQAEVTA